MASTCPTCRHSWEVPAGGEGRGGGTCPRCGAPASPATSTAPGEWMVRKADGQVYGPFPREVLIHWVRTGKILPDEEVSRNGGAWRIFARHEEFTGHFPSAAPAPAAPARGGGLDFRRRRPVPLAVVQSARGAVVVAVVACVALVSWAAIRAGIFVVPESTLDEAARLVARVSGGAVAPEAGSGRRGEVVAAVVAAHVPAPSASAVEPWLRGRAHLREGTLAGVRAAVASFEQAVANDPESPLALTGLAEARNRLMDLLPGDADASAAQRESFYLVEEAMAAGDHAVECLRARAWFLMVSGQLDEGLEVARRAASLAPDDAELALLLGTALLRRNGRLDSEAEEVLGRALSIDPALHEARLRLGLAALAAGDPVRAEREIREVLKVQDRSAGAHFGLGQALEARGALAQAAAEYRSAATLEPEGIRAALAASGLEYRALGRPGDAAALYARALDSAIGPTPTDRREALAHRAAALGAAGHPDEAVATAEEALALGGDDPVALFAAGMAHLRAGRPAEAAARFVRLELAADGLDPRDQARVFLARGEAARRSDDVREAVRGYSRALEKDPFLSPAQLALAGTHARTGQRAEAVAAALGALRKDPFLWRRKAAPGLLHMEAPDLTWVPAALESLHTPGHFDPDVLAALAVARLMAGDLAGARRAAEQSLADDPSHAAARVVLGLAALESRDLPGAEAALSRAMGQGGDAGAAALYTAEARLAAGDDRGAEEALRRALARDRASPWVHLRLAQIARRRGGTGEARASIDEASRLAPQLVDVLIESHALRAAAGAGAKESTAR